MLQEVGVLGTSAARQPAGADESNRFCRVPSLLPPRFPSSPLPPLPPSLYPLQMSKGPYSIEERGQKNTLSYKQYFSECAAAPIRK